MPLQQLERLRAVRRAHHPVAELLGDVDGVIAHCGIVLDDQHRLAVLRAWRDGLVLLRRGQIGRALVPREIELDARSLADLAENLHVSTGLPQETVDLRQAEPGALSVLCREERLKRLL